MKLQTVARYEKMKIGESIIEELIKDKEVISATVVGSYTKKEASII